MEHGCHSVFGCWPGAHYELGTARKEASGIMELRRAPQQVGTLGGRWVWGIPELLPMTPVCPSTLQVDRR